jgi:pimeloyl-ACP methyl ester carboxylesterase
MTVTGRTSIRATALVFVALIVGVVGVGGASAAVAGGTPDLAAAEAATFEPVRFSAADGIRVSGELIGSGSVGIAIAHDADATLSEWEPAARFLATRGYRVLLFDYRSSPWDSQNGSHPASHFRYDRDLAGAVGFLRAEGVRTVVLGGDGVGGLVALVTAGELGAAVAGTFVLSAGGISGSTDTLGDPTNPGDLNALPAVRRLATPLLVIAAASDSNAGPLYRATAAERKQRVVLPESALQPNMFGLSMWTARAAWAQKARAAVLAFLPVPG